MDSFKLFQINNGWTGWLNHILFRISVSKLNAILCKITILSFVLLNNDMTHFHIEQHDLNYIDEWFILQQLKMFYTFLPILCNHPTIVFINISTRKL